MGHRITKHTHKNKTHTKEVLFFTVVPYWKVSVRPYYSIIWRGLLQICDTHQLEKVSNTALFYHDDLMSPSVHDMYMYSNINARHKKFKTKQNKKKNLRVCLFTFVFSSTRSLQTIYFSRNVCTCMCVRRCFIAFAQSALWLHYDCILFSCDFCTPVVWLLHQFLLAIYSPTCCRHFLRSGQDLGSGDILPSGRLKATVKTCSGTPESISVWVSFSSYFCDYFSMRTKEIRHLGHQMTRDAAFPSRRHFGKMLTFRVSNIENTYFHTLNLFQIRGDRNRNCLEFCNEKAYIKCR